MSQAGILSIVVLAVQRLMCKIEKSIFLRMTEICVQIIGKTKVRFCCEKAGETPQKLSSE